MLRIRPGYVLLRWGWQWAWDVPSNPSHKTIISVPREFQLPVLWAAVWFTFFGKPIPAFPAFSSMLAAAPCAYRSKRFHKRLCCKGGQGISFHKRGNRDQQGRCGLVCFFPKFRVEIRLGHRCPYSAACFLHKTLLSSALQMQVEIFWNRGEFLSDLPLFQLRL